MALVITLILLSVTLIMAVAFLAVSRRERNAVTTTTDTASARLAADAALANAEAQIVANLFTTNNAAYNFGLLVSTNYINGLGFDPNPAPGSANPTNVNYDYTTAGNPLNAAQLVQNVANLFYLPRVPVYLSNLVTHTVENRFYLDLNRNGLDDPNGDQPVIGPGGFVHPDGTEDNNPANVVTNFQVGDPEWIGELEHPDAPHGPNNRFVSRFAFVAVPVGNALDINAIHNQAYDNVANRSLIPPNDEFFRNQGVGSWEINLAAFLADLNTNQWGQIIDSPSYLGGPPGGSGYYQYNEPFSLDNGRAFNDALSLLAHRYANTYQLLAPVGGNSPNGLFTTAAVFPPFQNNVDAYDNGPLQTTFAGINVSGQNILLPWAGADNTNQFFTTQELFDPGKTETGVTPPGFTDRLLAAGTNTFGGNTVPTYDRYTFYRMLDELGSDSTPESGKINLNYSNAVVNYAYDAISGSVYPMNIAIVPNAETNFLPWTAPAFFMAAADQMLRLYTTNWFQRDPSNYLVGYYGITNYYSYTYVSNGTSFTIIDSPDGLGLTNVPFFGMTNEIPSFGVTNIPVWANGQFVYTPAVNRLLRLAANIYDAVNYASNYVAGSGSYPGAFLPSVFRPLFDKVVTPTTTNVYICGFNEVTNLLLETDQPFSRPYNLANPYDLANLSPTVPNDINVFGVPMIIGAKKGFPNFNEFYMESAFQLTRKLMVTRQNTNVPAPAPNPTSSFWQYNVMYNLSLNNQFGVECWNSYRSNYMRPIDIFVTNFLVMTLTNDENNFTYTTNLVAGGVLFFPSITNVDWPGYTNAISPLLSPGSFQTPLTTNFAAVPTSRYLFNGGSPYLSTNLNLWYETGSTPFGQYPQPRWGLTVTNNLQVIMVDMGDSVNPRIIDYVQLSGPNSIRDLTREIMSLDTINGSRYNDLWDTNVTQGIPNGFAWQFNVSQASTYSEINSYWQRDTKTDYDQMNAFRAFTLGSAYTEYTYPGYVPDQTIIGAATMTNAMQMPYYPSATVVQDIVWQANDPLVHYMAGDLVNTASSTFINSPFTWDDNYTYADNFAILPGSGFSASLVWPPNNLNWPGNLGKLNQRYQPWGGNPSTGAGGGTNLLAVKDPLVTCSDDWNFPTNKFPTVGWLGRVHRGTPWQTVYLKASDVLAYQNNFNVYGQNGPNLWVNWTGNVNPYDVTNTAPKQDRLLFDVFTTAFNDNATRGTLSVNQPHLAAWSALFSGVIVLSNNAVNPPINQTASSMTNFIAFPISPAGPGTNSAMWQLWNGITQTRAAVSNYDGVTGAFEHVGDILVVPQLTERSPFLNSTNSVQYNRGISDEMYEWLPQQVMSLLREGSPRYVIYCYGQALKPAANSLVTSGAYFGMCTNYQVVAESAARAVVRVDGAGTPTPHVVVESYNPLPPD